jgi:soluble lytic murein transglycosylase
VRAQEQGEVARAAELFAAIAKRHELIADYAGWLEARSLLDLERAGEAARAAQRALERVPDSPISSRLYRVLGDADLALDREEQARAAWESARAASREAEEQAALSLAIGGSHERADRVEAAAREYRELWVGHPTLAEGEEGGKRLAALEADLGEPLRSAPDFLKRADRLFAAHRNEASFEAYGRALRGPLKPSELTRARKRRARILFRLRRYQDAEKAFRALGSEPEARLWTARSLARAGRVQEAIRAFEALSSEANGPEARRAHLLVALLLDGEEEGERARRHYIALVEQKRAPGLAAAALWRLGWAAYRNQRAQEARERLSQLVATQADPLESLRARYWAARALETLEPKQARSELEELARAYPFSYYGWRASQRIALNGAPVRPERPIARGRAVIADRELARARVLLEGGLQEELLRELRRLARKARGLDDRLELARLFSDAGDFHGAERLLVDAYAEALARGPVPGLEELWWLAWPDAYRELVKRALPAEATVETELVYAVMREESGYRPEVVSAAGALGLLQIMPETGEHLARELGLGRFSTPDLFTPAINLRLGGFYLENLARRFGGNLAAAIASYNAGPEAVARWIDAPPSDDDVWVESIPYQQTRGYVRRVLRSLQVYRALY